MADSKDERKDEIISEEMKKEEEKKPNNEEKIIVDNKKEDKKAAAEIPPAEKKEEKKVDKVEEKKQAEEQNFALLPPKKAEGEKINTKKSGTEIFLGPGENGKPFKVDKEKAEPEIKERIERGWKNNAYNEYVSDLISVHRLVRLSHWSDSFRSWPKIKFRKVRCHEFKVYY